MLCAPSEGVLTACPFFIHDFFFGGGRCFLFCFFNWQLLYACRGNEKRQHTLCVQGRKHVAEDEVQWCPYLLDVFPSAGHQPKRLQVFWKERCFELACMQTLTTTRPQPIRKVSHETVHTHHRFPTSQQNAADIFGGPRDQLISDMRGYN